MEIILVGLLGGIAFGFLLQKGKILRYETQIDAMQLKAFTIFKFMMSAMITGSIGIHLLSLFKIIDPLKHEPLSVFGIVVGGLIFGLGWGLLGSCPGTGIGSIGTGRVDVIFGLLGLIVGSVAYAAIYPLMNELYVATTIGNPGIFGNLPMVIGVPLFVGLILLAFKFIEKKGL